MPNSKLIAGQTFPALTVKQFNSEQHAAPLALHQPAKGFDWRLLVIYRGKHCPLCTRYLAELEVLKEEFYAIGVDIAVASADSLVQVSEHMANLTLSFPIGYDLTTEQMQQLGLYLSSPRSAAETDHVFAEPGLFVINDHGELQVIDISNGPFARPDLKTLAAGLAFIRNPENNYPIRGTWHA
ncbi:redoxin family protein [Shewanella corallii]|uniref:Redoxin family protein n=1 Tax=Shewanella corallii TaxID=560080 RepID=A0ABT0N697_9GAMM|nr:redoxin family protein [Shewanella corallii]MCL2913907.1 redoxin family protein [Shewanella corallii]